MRHRTRSTLSICKSSAKSCNITHSPEISQNPEVTADDFRIFAFPPTFPGLIRRYCGDFPDYLSLRWASHFADISRTNLWFRGRLSTRSIQVLFQLFDTMILLILSYSPPLIVATLPCASYPSPPLIVATLPAPPASNKSNSASMPLLCRQYQFLCAFAPFIHHLLPARVSIKSGYASTAFLRDRPMDSLPKWRFNVVTCSCFVNG